ncbi:MAG: hypothetical protein WCA16_07115 [Candidatus Sulfotelmatobacter sp.]
MLSGRQDPKNNKWRWLKWIVVPSLVLGFLAVALYAALFTRIVPPRSVRIVDALTGKPLADVNVCMQATGSFLGPKEALESDLRLTGASGRVFFGPSILNLGLRRFDGYTMQVTDSKSGHVQNCGTQVGLEQGLYSNPFIDDLADASTDGSQHFPVELVPKEALPKNASWFPVMRDTTLRSFMSVKLIPILDGPDQCKQISDPGLLQECVRLNTMAQNALLQSLAPMYFAGMRRATVQTMDVPSSKSRIYNFVYESQGVPPRYILVTIERFTEGQNAQKHLEEIGRVIPNYDPKDVTEEEPVRGERIKRILSAQNPRAFWASNNQLILITFVTPSPLDQIMPAQWLRLHPSSARSSDEGSVR